MLIEQTRAYQNLKIILDIKKTGKCPITYINQYLIQTPCCNNIIGRKTWCRIIFTSNPKCCYCRSENIFINEEIRKWYIDALANGYATTFYHNIYKKDLIKIIDGLTPSEADIMIFLKNALRNFKNCNYYRNIINNKNNYIERSMRYKCSCYTLKYCNLVKKKILLRYYDRFKKVFEDEKVDLISKNILLDKVISELDSLYIKRIINVYSSLLTSKLFYTIFNEIKKYVK